MNSGENNNRSIAMIVTSMLIFGSIGIFRRYIPFSSAFLAFTRGIIGSLFIIIFMLIKRRKVSRPPLAAAIWLVLTGAIIGFNWMMLFEAYNYTTVATATLCYYMEPTIVVLVSPIFLHERLTGKKMACSIIAILGMILVSGVINGDNGAGDIRGVLLGLGAAVLYATVIIMNKKIVGINPYLKTTIQLLSAGLVMIPYLLLTKEVSILNCDAKAIILMLCVGLIHTGIAYVLYFGSMEGLKAQSIAILSYIDPVSALFFSTIFLKERLSAMGLIGAIMIIGAALVSEIRFPREQSAG